MEYPAAQSGGPINGFFLATVVSNSEEKHKGTLKVELTNEGKTKNILENVKVLTPFCGDQYGVFALPEVGEQVLVGFLGGRFDRPFVFGSLYAAADKMLSESFDKKNERKRMVTKGGNVIEISDKKDNETITVKTPKKLVFSMKQKEETITLDVGDVTVTLDGKKGELHIKAKQKIVLETGSSKLTMESGGKLEAKGTTLKISGSSVTVDSSGSLKCKGMTSEFSGTTVNVKGSGTLTLKSPMTNFGN